VDATAAKSQLRPFWGRIIVAPSPVDEAQHKSGLIVPTHYEGDDDVKRGIVLAADLDDLDDELPPGTVVYYVGGIRVLDLIVLDRQEVLAYHEGDD
jgi:hypothetical protein